MEIDIRVDDTTLSKVGRLSEGGIRDRREMKWCRPERNRAVLENQHIRLTLYVSANACGRSCSAGRRDRRPPCYVSAQGGTKSLPEVTLTRVTV